MINVAQELAMRYGGTVAQRKDCELYLKEDQTFILGIDLNDPKSNFYLLSEYDLQSLSESTRTICVQTRTSPFRNMKLIVYKTTDKQVHFKILHGMASRLITEMAEMIENGRLG